MKCVQCCVDNNKQSYHNRDHPKKRKDKNLDQIRHRVLQSPLILTHHPFLLISPLFVIPNKLCHLALSSISKPIKHIHHLQALLLPIIQQIHHLRRKVKITWLARSNVSLVLFVRRIYSPNNLHHLCHPKKIPTTAFHPLLKNQQRHHHFLSMIHLFLSRAPLSENTTNYDHPHTIKHTNIPRPIIRYRHFLCLEKNQYKTTSSLNNIFTVRTMCDG